MSNSSNDICIICKSSSSTKLTKIGGINLKNDNLTEQQQLLCKKCSKDFSQIQKHVLSSSLIFGMTSNIGRKIVSLYYDWNPTNLIDMEKSSENQNHMSFMKAYPGYDPQRQPIYNNIIEDVIKKNKFYEASILPMNYRYFLYCCNKKIPTKQRHERVKNVILRVMVGLGIPIACLKVQFYLLKSVSILVQICLCYLADTDVYTIMNRLWDVFEDENDQVNGWGWLLLNSNCINIMNIIQEVSKQGSQMLQKASSKKEMMKSGSIKNMLENQDKQFTVQKKHSTSQFQFQTPTRSQKRGARRMLSFNESHPSEINENIFEKQALKEIYRMKNHCTFLMTSFLEEQQRNREVIKEIQNKFKKEKQQYISTIIALKERIFQLENGEILIKSFHDQGKISKPNQQAITSALKIQQQYFSELTKNLGGKQKNVRFDEEASNRVRAKTVGKLQKMQFKSVPEQQNINKKQLKRISIQQRAKIAELQEDQSLISQYQINQQDNALKNTNITMKMVNGCSFQQFLDKIAKNVKIEPNIIDSINNQSTQILKLSELSCFLAKQLEKNQNKCKKQDLEIKRLLTIMKRKQQRMIPLLHQKDQQIQTYENALWKLQNGLPMGDNKLNFRIQKILQLQYQRNKISFESQKMLSPQPSKKSVKKIQAFSASTKKQISSMKSVQGTKPAKKATKIQSKQHCVIF